MRKWGKEEMWRSGYEGFGGSVDKKISISVNRKSCRSSTLEDRWSDGLVNRRLEFSNPI